MITRDQFSLQMDRLIDCFGDKFPEQREHMIWEAVSGLDYAVVIGIVDGFIRSSKYAPMPSDFIEAVNEHAKHGSARKFKLGELRPLASCHQCADSGFIRLKRKDEHEPWAKWASGSAPCYCPRGRELIEAGKRRPKGPIDLGPQFHESWLKSYEVIPSYIKEPA